MAIAVPSDVRETVALACARNDVLDACRRRDLGAVIAVLNASGVTQGKLAEPTGIPQGRLSEYKTGKYSPKAVTIFEAFADGLGMPAAAREALGLAADSPPASPGSQSPGLPCPDVGLRYPDTPAHAAGNLGLLWRSDLAEATAQEDRTSGRASQRAVLLAGAALVAEAWNEAALRWLVTTGSTSSRATTAGVRVGLTDVDRFCATAEMFRRLDDRFGGGHAREARIQYLRTDAERLLRGRYSDTVGPALFSAVAEATLLAAWMSYDSMPGSSLAQRYFIQALALAQAGNDRLLGASVLDAMSHQATYAGRRTNWCPVRNLERSSMIPAR
jgi:hypothetical protein